MFRGERGGDGGGTEGENTTRRKVARTFSDMYTPPSSSYTQLSSYKDKNALPKYDVTCHEFNHFQPCVTFYQDV